jgi:hypothetical protein
LPDSVDLLDRDRIGRIMMKWDVDIVIETPRAVVGSLWE